MVKSLCCQPIRRGLLSVTPTPNQGSNWISGFPSTFTSPFRSYLELSGHHEGGAVKKSCCIKKEFFIHGPRVRQFYTVVSCFICIQPQGYQFMKMSLDLKSLKVTSEVTASVAGRADCCSMISLFLHKRATKDTKLTAKPSQMVIVSFFLCKDRKT